MNRLDPEHAWRRADNFSRIFFFLILKIFRTKRRDGCNFFPGEEMVIFAKWNNAKVSRRERQGSEPETKMTKDKGSDFSFVSVFFFFFI